MFLYQALKTADALFDDRVDLNDDKYKSVQDMNLLYPPFMQELDSGQGTAWKCVQRDYLTYAASECWVRELGYVFMERARLDACHVFQPWCEAPDTTAAEAQVEFRRATLWDWDKCPRRAHIYELGGRGWWSPNNESRVVYPQGRGPAPKPDSGEGKTSQQAADDFLREIATGGPKERPAWQTWEPRVPVKLSDVQRAPEWR